MQHPKDTEEPSRQEMIHFILKHALALGKAVPVSDLVKLGA